METLLLQCRPGFEADCAAELADRDPSGYARATPDTGFLTWHSTDPALLGRPLIFARSGFVAREGFSELPETDRLADLLPVLQEMGKVSAVWLEHPDTNDGRSLQRFLKRFRGPLEAALRREGILTTEPSLPILHLFFIDFATGWAGISAGASGPAWENGIPRLRLPAAAPSRSALKIEEAWLRLMNENERHHWLRAGRDVVDLGAAPGGWSWQLARHGLRVTGVDHGRLAGSLMEEYPVRHVSADAFTWRPPRPVDWVVCDVVDKPARTLALMEKWMRQGWARVALFNLKLPMKKRFATVAELLGRLKEALPAGTQIRAAQLYHDREEITVLVLPGGAHGAG